MTVGDYLVAIRKKAGLSQGRVASLAGVSQSTLSDIEKNGRDPTLSTFISICTALAVSPAKSLSIIIGEDPDFTPNYNPFSNRILDNHEMEVLYSLIDLMPSQQAANKFRTRVDGVAAAGSPIIEVDFSDDEYIRINPKYMDNQRFIVIKAKGDSMMPDISDGDYVVVQRHRKPRDGDIALVFFSASNGFEEYSIKHYFTFNGSVKLVSSNEKYPPMIVQTEDILSIEKVVDIIHSK